MATNLNMVAGRDAAVAAAGDAVPTQAFDVVVIGGGPAGMGRCQSGFCQSRVVAILARELGCDPSEVLLEDTGSWLVEGPLKGVR